MSQQFDELEQRIGYQFRNREHLRRALTCQSAIHERHPDATDQNYQNLEYVGDAALKYVIATILYMEQNGSGSVGELNDRVLSYISNSNLSRIGYELNLSKYIIKGRGVAYITDKMLADAVEAILGAIVIDQQQQQENASENVLFDVVSRVFSIKWKGKSMLSRPNNSNKKRCSCCKCFFFIILMILIFVVIMLFVSGQVEL